MRASRILETVLYARDLDAMRAFYDGVIGLEVHSELPGKFVFFRMADQMLLIFNPDLTANQKTEDGPPPHGTEGAGHICFRCGEGDLERWRAHLEGKAVPIEKTLDWPQGGRSIYFRDPAGNSVEFSDGTLWGFKPMRTLANRKIVIATHNKGKLAEFAALLAPYGVEAVSAGELGLPEPAETESSFAGNARIKAFGVYVHWPFCKAKCPYCDFNSHVRHRPVDQAAFAAALGREIARFAELAPGRIVTSIFFGGGTPSLMEPSTVGTVLDAIAGHWTVAGDVETSLEANPTSVEAANFAAYRAAGINRVSLGVQALDDDALRLLGRQHSAAEAVDAFAVARAHFDRVSFDLIYARPRQTVEAWSGELSRAVALAIDHLSLYQLTIEPGTAYFDLHERGKLVTPADDCAADLYDLTQELTQQAGLSTYEVSNHAAAGQESRHNLLYWRYGEYAGQRLMATADGRKLLNAVIAELAG
jgi:putative oxygen-independent coproporphyrinogen III oxidase